MPASSVVGAAELIAAGFEPLELLTGSTTLAGDWPNQHKRSLSETRPDRLPDDQGELVWFVRSPWPRLTPEQVLDLITTYLTHDNEPRWPEVTREIFAWSDERAVAVLNKLNLRD